MRVSGKFNGSAILGGVSRWAFLNSFVINMPAGSADLPHAALFFQLIQIPRRGGVGDAKQGLNVVIRHSFLVGNKRPHLFQILLLLFHVFPFLILRLVERPASPPAKVSSHYYPRYPHNN